MRYWKPLAISFARYMVRVREMHQSARIIEQLIDNIPEGDFQAKTKAVLKLPKGEFYSRVETARGELGVLHCERRRNHPLQD